MPSPLLADSRALATAGRLGQGDVLPLPVVFGAPLGEVLPLAKIPRLGEDGPRVAAHLLFGSLPPPDGELVLGQQQQRLLFLRAMLLHL